VQQPNRDFLATHDECRLVLDLPTPGNGHPSFWNGLQVLAWERGMSGTKILKKSVQPAGALAYPGEYS